MTIVIPSPPARGYTGNRPMLNLRAYKSAEARMPQVKKTVSGGLPFTKEPGSWVMFAVAFFTGAAVSGFTPRAVLVFAALALVLMAKAPLLGYLRKGEKDALGGLLPYLLPGLGILSWSVWMNPPLAFLYLAGGLLFALYYYLEKRKKLPLIYSEAAGMAVMGLAAVIGASLAGDMAPWTYLWPMFFVFYFASSFRVRLFSKDRKYRLMGVIYSGAVLLSSAALALKGHLIFISFLPLVEDLYSSLRPRKEKFRAIGLKEAVKAVIFAAILIAVSV